MSCRGCSVTSRNVGIARFVVALLMLLSTPVGASSVVMPDDSYPGPAPDVMAAGDAGQTRPQSVEVQQTAGWRLVANGPLFAVFTSQWQLLNSTIEQAMWLHADDPRIDFHTRVEWRDKRKLLKGR